jgi:hypothetical protein
VETEQLFLFLIYLATNKHKVEKGVDVYYYNTEIKRASMQRRLIGDEQYERVPIEFDPMGENLCYVVGMISNMDDRGIIMKNKYEPLEIFLHKAEADQACAKIKETKGKGHLSKKLKQTFEDAMVSTVAITHV